MVPLTALWATLAMQVSIIENAAYIHDHAIPRWQPITLIIIPTLILVTWLVFELRSSRYLEIPLESWRPWFYHQLWRLPLLASGYFVLVFGLRHAIFSVHGTIYAPGLSWQTLYVFEFIKSTLFYCLWLGRVYGVLSILRSREQSAQLVVVQAALARAFFR